MGEESWRIKTIGMHELNNLKKQKNFSLKYLNKKYFITNLIFTMMNSCGMARKL